MEGRRVWVGVVSARWGDVVEVEGDIRKCVGVRDC